MKRVLVLGAGYAGLEACKKLVSSAGGLLRRGELEITLVAREDYHTFHGFTGEVLGGVLPLGLSLTPLDTLPFLRRVRFVQGTVERVDLEARQATVQTGEGSRTLPYDHLFLGLGSRDPFERLPGLERFGWCLKNSLHMQRFRTELHGRIAASLAGARPLERVAIVGGGFAGVECAAALAELFREAYRGSPVPPPRLTLLHSGPQVLEGLRPRFGRLADAALKQLVDYGIDVRYGCRVQQITAAGAVLEDGQTLEADLVLVTAGISRGALPGTEALPRDPQGRLLTRPTLQVEGHDHLWSGGDLARVMHPHRPEPCPVNALWAMKAGLHAGANLARTLRGAPLRRFGYPGLGQAASLGWGRGISEIYGMQFGGLLGWLLRMGFFLWYMPSKARALKVLGHLLSVRRHGRSRLTLEPGTPRTPQPRVL